MLRKFMNRISNTLNDELIAVWIVLDDSKMAIFSIDCCAFFGPFCNGFWASIALHMKRKFISLKSLLVIHIVARWFGCKNGNDVL